MLGPNRRLPTNISIHFWGVYFEPNAGPQPEDELMDMEDGVEEGEDANGADQGMLW